MQCTCILRFVSKQDIGDRLDTTVWVFMFNGWEQLVHDEGEHGLYKVRYLRVTTLQEGTQ